MPTARSRLVDVSVTPWYHCISRCVRRAFLCGEGREHRKQWIENRLKVLSGIFAVECAGFSVMDNHLHVLLRLDAQKAEQWSAEEVARRWFGLFPLRDLSGKAMAVTDERVGRFAADAGWVAEARRRLGDLGWFMKCLKEPLARMANAEDGCSGAFWKGVSYSLYSPCLTIWKTIYRLPPAPSYRRLVAQKPPNQFIDVSAFRLVPE